MVAACRHLLLFALATGIALAPGCWRRAACGAEAATTAAGPAAFEWNAFLTPWQVLGPFPKLTKDQQSGELERELVPDEAALSPGNEVVVGNKVTGDKKIEWHAWPGRVVDFMAALELDPQDAEYSLAYAYTEFASESEQQAMLAIGHDDCVQIWLNGKEVYRKEAWGPSQLDQAKFSVTLVKGTNRLLAKVCQGTGSWEFAARLLPAGVDKPLIAMNSSGSKSGNVARMPLMNIDLLDAAGKVLNTIHASGGRAGSGSRYTVFAPTPEPVPAQLRVYFDQPGLLPFDKTYQWSQAANGSIWVSLSTAARIAGHIVDEKTGQPVVGAEVYAGESRVSKKSDANGRFEFAVRDPLADLVEVRAAGYAPRIARVNHDGEWTVKLTPGGTTIRGRVLTTDGEPIEGAIIKGDYLRRNINLQTDADGRFEVSGLPKGDREFYPTVSHPDYLAKDGFAQPLDEDGITDLEWRLERGAIVRGQVTAKDDGRPLEGIRIVAGSDGFASNTVTPEAFTDDKGRFELRGLAAGTNLLHAFSQEFVPVSLPVEASQDKTAEAKFELATGKAISGRVIDPAGKAVASVTLAIDTINGSRMLERRVNTDANGEFRFENMPDTPVRIDLFKQGWVSKRDFESTGGQHTELTLHPVVEHVLRVRAADTGLPLPQVVAQIGYQWQGRNEISWQDEDYSGNAKYDPGAGEVRIRADERPDAKMLYRVRAQGYQDYVFPLPALGGPAESIDVRLEKLASNRGKVVDVDTGQPIEGVMVALVTMEDRLRLDHYVHIRDSYNAVDEFTGIHATSGADGSFEISRPAGTLPTDLLLFHKERGFHYIHDARSALCAEGEVQLPLPAGGVIEGRVIVADKPVANAPVHLTWVAPGEEAHSYDAPFGYGGQTKTDAEGRFRYAGLGPGSYRINRLRSFDAPSGNSSMSSYLTGSNVLVLPGQTVTHDFVQPAGHAVKGEAVDQEGKPLANCHVEIMPVGDRTARTDVAMTKGDGRFEFLHLQPGSYALRAQQYLIGEHGGFNHDGGSGEGAVTIVDGDVTTSIKIAARDQANQTRIRSQAAPSAAVPTIVGSLPPDFSGKLFGSDKTFNLADHYGKVVAIDFWATWCGPCMAVMPEMKQLYEKYKGSDDVVFVTVSLDQDADALKSVLESQEIAFPVVHESRETSQAIASGFGVSGIPASFVIGRDGRFAADRVHGSQLLATLETAVKAPVVPRFAAGVKPSRLTVKLALDEGLPLPGATITFKALDDIGMPVGEEKIRLAGQTKQATWLYAPFELGGTIDVKVEVDGLEPQQKKVESPAEKAEVAFQFESPRMIRGTLELEPVAATEDAPAGATVAKEDPAQADATPKPLADIKINVISSGGVQRATTSDNEGRFEIRVLPGEYYLIPAGNADLAPIQDRRMQVLVGADEDPAPSKIAMCRTVTVNGTVTDEAGQPVAGADIRSSAGTGSVSSDAEGNFSLPGVPSRGPVQLIARKQPKVAVALVTDCDGTQPQALVLSTRENAGTSRLAKGMTVPKLRVATLSDGEPIEWKPTAERDTLLLFAPLWHASSREFVAGGKAWADEHDAELVVVSLDWSAAQAQREAKTLGDTLPADDRLLYASPGGLQIDAGWALKGRPQAYRITNGKIAAAPPAGKLP